MLKKKREMFSGFIGYPTLLSELTDALLVPLKDLAGKYNKELPYKQTQYLVHVDICKKIYRSNTLFMALTQVACQLFT